MRSVEQLRHILDQVVVQAQVLHLLLQVPQLLLRVQQGVHPGFESVVLDDQVADVLLLACQDCLQVLDVLLPAGQFVLEVLLHADFVVAHHNAHLALLVLDGCAGLQLQGLDVALLQPQFSS